MKKKLKKIKSQIWVETAVYTLIGLVIIAVVLSIISPQIQKTKEKSAIEQIIIAMEFLNSKIIETEQAPGNIRIVDFKISEGKLEIDSENDSLIYTLENSMVEFSESGEEISEGNLIIRTEKTGSRFKTIITLPCACNILYNNHEVRRTLSASPQFYKLKIENIGSRSIEEPIHIDFGIL